MSERVVIVAPTDAQLSYIASLARLNGYPPPVVYSKHEASEIITALRTGTYRPEDCEREAAWQAYDEPDERADDEQARYEAEAEAREWKP